MIKPLILACGLLGGLAGCQQQTNSSATTAPTSYSEADALSAVRKYVQEQPNAGLFVVDSASVIDAGTQWQVLVPRTDWANRMPNRAAFEVDKASGQVSTRPVK
ncbi:hypothetical protein [Hymenobacter sp. BT730]|uniref:hypothetical protein n=1 Tax=Hymenobacter sp. BT730 TaxID=3063332 RepID=UPI0026DF0A37|nr:hypothetical protein [Hymenobacter sp. BT730]